MQFMLTWRIPPGSHKTAVESFLEGGAPVPEKLKSLGRWHVPGSPMGWHLVEGDAVALGEHVAEWANLLEIEVSPVIGDDDAGAALSRVYGK